VFRGTARKHIDVIEATAWYVRMPVSYPRSKSASTVIKPKQFAPACATHGLIRQGSDCSDWLYLGLAARVLELPGLP
jgi:hypothetical protein